MKGICPNGHLCNMKTKGWMENYFWCPKCKPIGKYYPKQMMRMYVAS